MPAGSSLPKYAHTSRASFGWISQGQLHEVELLVDKLLGADATVLHDLVVGLDSTSASASLNEAMESSTR